MTVTVLSWYFGLADRKINFDNLFKALKTMKKLIIEEGVLHIVPDDIKAVLISKPELLERWNKLTPLARNEWICWTTIVKQEETRKEHIQRLSEDILEGKKRPCCWPGCPHRRESAKKWFKNLDV